MCPLSELIEDFFKQNKHIENKEINDLLKNFLTGQINDEEFKSSFLSICETEVSEE